MLDIGGKVHPPRRRAGRRGRGARPGAPGDRTPCGLRAVIAISVDTMKPAVARAAVAAGCDDLERCHRAAPFAADSLATLAAELGCDIVLMHMQGEPGTMQAEPHYDDVVAEVAALLAARATAAMAAGVARECIWVDPGIGFGKHTTRHNLPLLAGLPRIVALGFPVLLGASRKGFILALDGGRPPSHPSGWEAPSAGALAGGRGRRRRGQGPRCPRDRCPGPAGLGGDRRGPKRRAGPPALTLSASCHAPAVSRGRRGRRSSAGTSGPFR